MKKISILFSCLLFSFAGFCQQEKTTAQKDSFLLLEPVEVKASRAGNLAPFTKTNISAATIEKNNLGQDIPFLLNQIPSAVINSDAGNGVGYTGIRIRGTDATRINVTLNGIPYNDPESQGTFFVDMPDFMSSVGSIQVQRGVGTSSNGTAAFGATINISTNEVKDKPYTEFNNTFGSFNTWKNTLKIGSGLINDHFTADFRLSRISSDGYVDRATSDLKSYYFSTAYFNKKSSIRFNNFSGDEKTYQAWYGVSESDLKTNRTSNPAGMDKPGSAYKNETDNYKQDHYQLFFNHKFTESLTLSNALFYIKGKGYYEQYKADQKYSKYGLPNQVVGTTTISRSDMIRRLWLDNDFYGNILSLQYRKNNHEYTLGGGLTKYDGKHFGEILWAEKGLKLPAKWYDLNAFKSDANIYFKQLSPIAEHLNLFYDLQYRHVSYDINGFRNNPGLKVNTDYDFFNPKLGVSFNKNGWTGYVSHAIANKEPNRADFETGATVKPKYERLNDTELGFTKRTSKTQLSMTLYHMLYKDQLVLTGKINDVGAYTRTNIPESYRAGIELEGSMIVTKKMNVSANLSFSKNKIKNTTEFIDNYDIGGQKINNYSNTDIAYSPSIIGGTNINLLPCKNFELNLTNKYVGKQYLDNTQNENRKLNAFFVQDINAIYTIRKSWMKEANIILQLNNVFDKKYEPNGYTYSFISGGSLVDNNYYFPMAGTNFMLGLNIKL
jgi:iron complex outermembrane recepter protein